MWVNGKGAVLVAVVAALCQAREASTRREGIERRIGSSSSSSPSSPSSSSSSSSESTAPEITLDSASMFGVSNLAKLISSALKDKEATNDKDSGSSGEVLETTSSFFSSSFPAAASTSSSSPSTSSSPPTSSSTSTTERDSTPIVGDSLSAEEDRGVTEKGEETTDPNKSLQELLMALAGNQKKGEGDGEGEEEEDKNKTTGVKFVPATAGQFGELGTGSKLMEYLPDLSQYSIETGNYGALAGAGAVALMALGAVFAVPAAPVILRRAGMDGWSGLPSFSDLFTWWSSPDPAALTWADKNDAGAAFYEDNEGGYYYNGGGEGLYYDSEGYAVPAPGGNEYYTDGQYQYYSYDTTGSGSEDAHQYTDSQGNIVASAPAPMPAHGGYLVHASRADQAASTRAPARGPPHGMKRPLWKRNKNRRKDTVDGHEYVTLEEINRIGDESMRILSDLAQGHFERRRGPAPHAPQQTFRRRQQQTYGGEHQQERQQYQYAPQPSYEQGQELFTQSYATQEAEGEYDPSTGAEGHPYRFSLTDEAQQAGQGDAGSHHQEQERPQGGYSRHNLGYLYAGAEAEEDVGSPRTSQDAPLKMAEEDFPYKFHKED
ncbi:uncharacterized protein LOC134779727 [Penaeus indicus]|uniref:uncharacterized protein LOC134779727 n=1 Tax=Penaeus indicus TaxID=29960 RepID=UPI00300CA539